MKQATLIEALQEHVAHKPEATAVYLLNDSTDIAAAISYQALFQQARIIGKHLLQHCQPGDRALMLYENGPEFILAFLACLQAGVVAVPAYPPRRNQNSDRLRSLVQDANCPLILSTEKLVGLFAERIESDPSFNKVQIIRTDKDIDVTQPLADGFQFPAVSRDDLAFLQYSSGSTGDPKGVMVTQGNITDNVQYMFEGMGHDQHTVSVSWLPNFHDMGLISGILEPIYYGYPVYLMSPTQFLQRPLNWLKAISRYKATSTGAPNFAYDLCVERYRAEEVQDLDLSSLRTAYNGAEPIRAQTLINFSQCYAAHGFKHVAHLPCYGMAEVTLYATGTPVDQEPRVVYADQSAFAQNRVEDSDADSAHPLVSAGVPMYADDIQIVDASTCQALGDNRVGEIWLKVNSIAQGYLNKPEQTQQTFHAHLADPSGTALVERGEYLRTGDLGFVRDGWLFVTGRVKDMIILNGRNYYPQDIELEAMKAHEAVADNNGAAFSITAEGGEKIVLVQELRRTEVRKKQQFPDIIQAVRNRVAEQLNLPLYDIVLVKPNSVQKTSSGKIQRSKNQQLYREGHFTSLLSYLDLQQTTATSTPSKPSAQTNPAPESQTTESTAAKEPSQPPSSVALALQDKIVHWLANFIADKTGLALSAIEQETPFMAQGIDSASGVNMLVELSDALHVALPATLVYDYSNCRELAEHIVKHYPSAHFHENSSHEISSHINSADDIAAQTRKEPEHSPQSASSATTHQYATTQASQDRDIAIIGVANRFAHASNHQEFWAHLHAGNCLITAPSAARLALLPGEFFDGNDAIRAGYVTDIECFDAGFFNISATEATHVDPQQRLLMEQSYQALRDAEIALPALAGSNTGVYIGQGATDYMTLLNVYQQTSSAYLGTGNCSAIAANRLSYFYDLHGPSLTVDTACSASLVALGLAIDDLRAHKTDLALVGGVNLAINPKLTQALSSANMLAADGLCKVFDAAADGYVRGEGAAVLVLKRQSDALAQKDDIKATIKGYAVYQDGKSNGLTAPNGLAQQQVIAAALADAKLKPEAISYLEMHGTGTELGDPIEVNAAIAAYQRQGEPLLLGAVKANVGHLEAAAGLAGLCKLIHCLQQQALPPQLHIKQLNPHVNWAAHNVAIPQVLTQWQSEQPRVAALSSFGFGGTNSHVIVQQAPVTSVNTHCTSIPQSHLLALSAKSSSALLDLLTAWKQTVADLPAKLTNAEPLTESLALADLTRRSHQIDTSFKYRAAVQGQTSAQLQQALERKIAQLSSLPPLTSATTAGSSKAKTVFLFTGQGAQYLTMGRDYYQQNSLFRACVDECLHLLKQQADLDLSAVWLQGEDAELLTQTQYAQPALFVIEYALGKFWQSLGIQGDYFIGHSVGEYAAACLAGVFSLADGLRLIAKRGRLLQDLPANGGMMAVESSVQHWQQQAKGSDFEALAVASDHGVAGCVVSGELALINQLPAFLAEKGIRGTQLKVSNGFHSALVEPALAEFRTELDKVTWFPNSAQTSTRLISTLTGQVESQQLGSADYWCRQLRECVQLDQALQTLASATQAQDLAATHSANAPLDLHFIELGPKPILLGLVQQILGKRLGDNALCLPSLRENIADSICLAQSLGQLFEHGATLNWSVLDADLVERETGLKQRISLPAYPFQRKAYWFPTSKQGASLPLSNLASSPVASTLHQNAQIAVNSEETRVNQEAYQAQYKADQAQEVKQHVLETFAHALSCTPDDIDPELSMLEMGADSLVISHVIRSIERRYGLDFSVRQIYEEVTTPKALTEYIVATLPDAPALPAESEASTTAQNQVALGASVVTANANGGAVSLAQGASEMLQQVLALQLQQAAQVSNESAATAITSVSQAQLQWLGQQEFSALTTSSISTSTSSTSTAASAAAATIGPSTNSTAASLAMPESNSARRSNAGALPGFKIKSKTRSGMTEQQQTALAAFSQAYIAKTRKSREQTIAYRPVLADSRASAGFRLSTKSMLYPIYADRAQGCRTWDIDGNEYLDITMGFGVNLFGHQPSFVVDAINQQLHTTMQLGLQVELSGKVAQLLCELTGHERAAFCNSGTEAVMTALRLACTKTKRSKIVQFETAYHGHFDGTLGQVGEDGLHAEPTAPGVRAGSVADVIMLDYGNPESLDIIRQHAHELAAVIVEPVQSRRPELQPKEFLHALRQITQEKGICFIVDEMITGFRADIGGAQAYFGIKADLATYGKIIGGGLPIGAVVGCAEYMDGIDGGQWQYDDDSFPEAATTLFAGTFNKHPLTMAAAYAVLNEIKRRGPQLQKSLAEKTAYLCDTLNAYFAEQQLPIEMVYFTSLFRFKFNANLDLLFFQLIHHGIYVWEGRNCFIADAHSDQDIEKIIAGIKQSVKALQRMGFISGKQNPEIVAPKAWQLSDAQQQLFALHQMNKAGSLAYHLYGDLAIQGELDREQLNRAIQDVIARHSLLNVVVDEQGQTFVPVQSAFAPTWLDFSSLSEAQQQQALSSYFDDSTQDGFSLTEERLIRIDIIKRSDTQWHLAVTVHHVVADGLSLDILLSEIADTYNALQQGIAPELPTAFDFNQHQQLVFAYLSSEQGQQDRHYWLTTLAQQQPLVLPFGASKAPAPQFAGASVSRQLSAQIGERFSVAARSLGCTRFTAFLGVYALWLSQLSQTKQLVFGMPVSGRALPLGSDDDTLEKRFSEHYVGYCSHLMPLAVSVDPQQTVAEHLRNVRSTFLTAFTHQNYPFSRLVSELQADKSSDGLPLISSIFNIDQVSDTLQFSGCELDIVTRPARSAYLPLNMNLTTQGEQWILDLTWQSHLFTEQEAQSYLSYFETLLIAVSDSFEQSIAQLPLAPNAAQVSQMLAVQTQQAQLTRQTSAPEVQGNVAQGNVAQSKVAKDKVLLSAILAQAKANPNGIAVADDQQSLTYQDLITQAVLIAETLQAQSTQAEQMIAICQQRHIGILVSMLAIQLAGAAYLPVDPLYPQSRIDYVLDDAQVAIVLCDQETQGIVNNGASNYQCLLIESLLASAQVVAANREYAFNKAEQLLQQICPQQLAYVIYTSGSTGNPKGVMIEHQQLANFALGMQERLQFRDQQDASHWLASTSLSFDISILELLVPLSQGGRVSIAGDQRIHTQNSADVVSSVTGNVGFSLFYFASDLGDTSGNKYDLLFDGARFADQNGFEAVWTPERHFATFGGLYSNPTITSAALASVTKNVKIRAGSCVSPLHNAVRLAEDWSMIDNVSDGRVGVAFAPGWQHNDFVLKPEAFELRHQLLRDNIATIQGLWRGENVDLENPHGDVISVLTKPRPVQSELPIWLTIAGNPDAFRYAGEAGHFVLTHLLGQRLSDVADKIRIYREAWQAAGHQGEGHVTLMIHTYVAEDQASAIADVEKPFKQYLKDSLHLLQGTDAAQGIRVDELDEEALAVVLDGAFKRYSETSALFGTVENCLPLVEDIKKIGVDELGCLIDFGVDESKVKQSLPFLNRLRQAANPSTVSHQYPSLRATEQRSLSQWLAQETISHFQCTPTHLSALLADTDFACQLQSLRGLLLGGEALPPSLLAEVHRVAPALTVHNMYGPTETTIWSSTKAFLPAATDSQTVISIGTAIRNTQLRIVDGDLQPVTDGETGELLIAGDGVARGYWQREALTAERFVVDGNGVRWYRTGDIAKVLANGELQCLGRVDQQVKIRGYRIELGEIENALDTAPAIAQSVVVAITTASGAKSLAAQIVLAEGISLESDAQAYCNAHLTQQLPSYMLPSQVRVVEALPMTPNGKIDRNAVSAGFSQDTTSPQPAAQAQHIQGETATVAQRAACEDLGEVGDTLRRLWAELLAKPIDQLNGQSNFFTLGGDSILAIQFVAKAKQQGLQISANQLFKFQTIAALVPRVQQRAVSQIDQSAISGEQILLPIHQQFLRVEAGKHHHNQAVMLTAPSKLTVARLTRLLAALVQRHDALRLRFAATDKGYQAHYAELPALSLANYVTAHSVQNAEEITELAEKYQRSLNIEQGPLFHGALFTLPTREQRLLLVIHHVAVDGVSWRVLLDDLNTLWAQIAEDQPLQLADKTHSYQLWGQLLNRYANSDALQAELEYWQQTVAEPARLDNAALTDTSIDDNRVADLHFTLPESLTQIIVEQAPQAFHSQIAEWLLASFLVSAQQQWQVSQLRVDLEGHGRELDAVTRAINSHQDLDISQTIGWFTSIFPIKVCDLSAEFAQVIAQTKQALRSVPHKGIGYGVAKYLRQDAQLAKAGNADVLFNYLGQFDQSSAEHFQFAQESVGEMMATAQKLAWPMIVNVMVRQQQLQVDISYDRRRFSDEVMQGFQQKLAANLSHLAQISAEQAQVVYSAADFPLAQVTNPEIQQWQQQFAANGLDDIYPATRLQQGLLFYSSLDSSAYITQIMWRMEHVDIEILQQAWRVIVQRHDVFRTAFDRLATEQPLQLVLAEAALGWTHHDLRELDASEQAAQFTALRLAEKAAGMQADQAPLTRFMSCQLSDSSVRILWSYHHALLDGWSVPILIEELGAIYAVLQQQPHWVSAAPKAIITELTEQAKLPDIVPYKAYIQWLADEDSQQALQYWQQLLQGIPVMEQAEMPSSEQDREASVQTVTQVLEAQDSGLLIAAAKAHQITLSVILQGAWSLLTCFQQSKDTAVFGTIVSGRANDLTDIDKIIGLFINTVPVRVDCPNDMRLVDWLQGLHQASAAREEYGYLPLSDIKQALNIPADKDLFRQLLVINNYPTSGNMGIDLAQVGLAIHDVESIEETNYELLMQAIYTQDSEQLTMFWRYNVAHFTATQINHFSAVFNQLLQFITQNLELSIADAMQQLHQHMQQLKQQTKTGQKDKRRRRRTGRSATTSTQTSE